MLVGEVNNRDREQARNFRQLTYTCMESQASRAPETIHFPKAPCKLGIMANHRFPTCWDGVNLDSPNHRDHVAYPESGTFESGGPCPKTHPVRLPQLLLESVWDTRQFNNKNDWPADGSQPFVWSSGDPTGFSHHADYLFGWKDDSLQKAMDAHTYVSAPMLKTQNIVSQNKCKVKDYVGEKIDGCKCALFPPEFRCSPVCLLLTDDVIRRSRAHCAAWRLAGAVAWTENGWWLARWDVNAGGFQCISVVIKATSSRGIIQHRRFCSMKAMLCRYSSLTTASGCSARPRR